MTNARSSAERVLMVSLAATVSLVAQSPRQTNVYFGDTHTHSSFSYDSYTMRNRTADPDVLFRYAKGLPTVHPYFKGKIQIKDPLDFLVVADHAEYLGITNELLGGNEELAATEIGRQLIEQAESGNERAVLVGMARTIQAGEPIVELNRADIQTTFWKKLIEITDSHNQPGEFTSLIGWEWTSFTKGATLHRVVMMREDSSVAAQFRPFSNFDSQRPEDLWSWFEDTGRRTGANFLAIPHNTNISLGKAFMEVDSDGRPITAQYARRRVRWEPLVEVTQNKGDSETHPTISTNDEFADFGTYERARLEGLYIPPPGKADYIRPALMRGLEIDAKVGVNPYKFGMIGSSDTHSGVVGGEEDNYYGGLAIDSTPGTKTTPLQGGKTGYKIGRDFEAAGLAAVWAEENTREAIFDAMRRKEVYATSGTKIRLRFFGGWSFSPQDAEASNLAEIGYSKGVPMGGDLTQGPAGVAPTFLIHAAKDPRWANLDRVQVIKGWLDDSGVSHESVFDVALSDGRRPDASGNIAPVGNTVDVTTASWTNTIGDAQLATVWRDPEFDPKQRAFYYARAIEIPTPRHTVYDAVALREDPPEGYKTSIQERAYSSPIWYTP